MEMNATGGLLSVIEKLNEELRNKKVSTPQEDSEDQLSTHQEQFDQENSERQINSSPQEDDIDKGLSNHKEQCEEIFSHQEQEEVTAGTTLDDGLHSQDGEVSSHQEQCDQVQENMKECDIREQLYITKDKNGQATMRVRESSTPKEGLKRGEKMDYLRKKMTLVRKKKEMEEKQMRAKLDGKGRRKTLTYRGAKIMEATEKSSEDIQDKSEVVIIGSDVCALFPSLTDIEVALICYQAILDSNVKFLNFNYRVASLYIAMHMTEEEQRRSPLYRVLPRRTTKNGVRPGVTANPKNEENWMFPEVEKTEFEERLIVAMSIQIGVLTMMSTH